VLVANRDIGLCKLPPPLCDVYDAQSCPAGEACRPLLHSSGFTGTVCRPAGVRAAGEACDDDADPCLPGLICITYADSGDKRCRRTCREHADCPAGEGACLGQTLSLGITFCY
jgi:hypothetical protein